MTFPAPAGELFRDNHYFPMIRSFFRPKPDARLTPRSRSTPQAGATVGGRPPRQKVRRPSEEELDWLASLVGLGYGQNPSCRSTLEIQLLGSDRVWRSGRVEGLARGDLLADFDFPVLVGELVAVRLQSALHRLTSDSLGLVHWRQRYLGRYLIGIFLREPLPQRLLSQYWMDARTELRFPARKQAQATFGAGRRSVPVLIVNYSRSGVRLVCSRRPNVGDSVEVQLEGRRAAGAVRFVRRDPRSQGFECGCELSPDDGLQLARAIQTHEARGYEFWQQAPEPDWSEAPKDEASAVHLRWTQPPSTP
jgi:hypothetical protein